MMNIDIIVQFNNSFKTFFPQGLVTDSFVMSFMKLVSEILESFIFYFFYSRLVTIILFLLSLHKTVWSAFKVITLIKFMTNLEKYESARSITLYNNLWSSETFERYDPSKEEHVQFIIKQAEKEDVIEVEEEVIADEPAVEVSKETFFEVDSTIKDLFSKPTEVFFDFFLKI